MKASQIAESIKIARQADCAVYIEGSPGIGKSQVVKQVSESLGISLIDIRLTLLDPVDLRGLPKLNGDDRVHWAIPDFLPRDGEGILLLDELPSAFPAVQVAAYQLILDRKLGDYTLPKGWSVIGAGNKITDRAVVHKMSTALRSRFIQLEFEVDTDDWITWAISKGDIIPEIMAFIRFQPQLLFNFDPKRDDKTFSCPRTWEFTNRILKINPPKDLLYGILAGTIGEGTAATFIGFLKVYKELPNLDLIIKQPTKAPIPTEPSVLYAVCMGLAHKVTMKNATAIFEYAIRLPEEFGILLVRDCFKVNQEVVKIKKLIDYAAEKHVIFS
jgi:hypothetical protein